jgi:hypothetical protein
LKESEQAAPLGVVLAFPLHTPEVNGIITKFLSPQAPMAAARWPLTFLRERYQSQCN